MPLLSRRSFCVSIIPAAAMVFGLAKIAEAEPVDDGTWSTHPTWPILKKTKLVTDSSGMVHATIAPEVLSLGGKVMSISGFVLPIEAATRYNHFILSRYSPECPFCPAGLPNEVIEVFSTQPISPTGSMIFVKGKFSVQNNVDAGLFYRLEKVVII